MDARSFEDLETEILEVMLPFIYPSLAEILFHRPCL